MPRKLKKPCAFPGCPNLTDNHWCEEHGYLETDEHRSGSRNGFYMSPDWKRKRKEYLDEHPFCVMCGRPASMVDHIVPIRQGGALLDDGNLQSLCRACHSAKSIRDGSRYARKVYTY